MSMNPDELSKNIDRVTPLARVRRQGQKLTAQERKQLQEAFLNAFCAEANLTLACQIVGVSRDTVYKWKKSSKAFAAQFAEAELIANDVIDHEIFRRSILGWQEPLVSGGKVVYDEKTNEIVTITKYSDTLTTLLAKSRMPKYREKQEINIQNEVNAIFDGAKDRLLAELGSSLPELPEPVAEEAEVAHGDTDLS